MTPSVDLSARSPPPKATLHCPSCGHESAIDGDWTVREEDDRVAYECPDCGSTITTRPRGVTSTTDGEGSLTFGQSD